MNKIKALKAKIEEVVGKMRSMLDVAEGESRDLTDEEKAQYVALEGDADRAQEEIGRLEKLEAREAAAAAAADHPHQPNFRRAIRDTSTPKEFRSIGEFLYALRFNLDDPRLQDCEYREFEMRDQSMGTGTEGGFAVPDQFRPELLQVQPGEAIFEPRCTVIPAGDPPDAKLTIPALDQTAAQNVYGGVTMYKVAEAGTLTESAFALKEVSLEPQGIGGYIQVSNKLLLNWQASGALIGNQLRKAMIGYKDTQFYNGNGIAGPLGVLSAPAAISVARATNNTIVTADINSMISRIKMGGNFVWIASQTTLPQLLTLRDTNNNNMFIFDASKPIPNSLLGIPLMFNDRSVALGTKGDLVLCDLSYYLIKQGSGPFVSASEHLLFLSNRTIIKIIENVDGKPWLSAALPLEGSASNTVSPFVILNVS